MSTLALRNVSEETEEAFQSREGCQSLSIRWPINCILIIVEANHLTQGPPYSKKGEEREESALD